MFIYTLGKAPEVQAADKGHYLNWQTNLKSQNRMSLFVKECRTELEQQVCRVAMGRSAITARSEPITHREIATTARDLADLYNKHADMKRKAYVQNTETLVKRFIQGVPQGGTLMYGTVLLCVAKEF